MQPTILGFLESYLKWAEEGGKHLMPFNASYGLCSNAAIFGLDYWDMAKQFHSSYAFNDVSSYAHDSVERIHHLNPKRIQWIKNKIEELKNESI